MSKHSFSKIILGLSSIVASGNAFSQTCADCRYLSPVFDSVTVETVKFGQGPRADGTTQELFMDIYQPFGDTASARAVAVFAFGGAFVTGSRDDWHAKLVCEHLAQAGYVAVSIDYRIYNDLNEMIAEILEGIVLGELQQMRIFFRPMQDMRASVQYLKADFAELGNNYRIDTSKILIGGASSGAITSLMTAYCDKESEMAEMSFGSTAALDELGGFYSTTGLYPNYSWKSLATYNVSGALINADWIEPGDIPAISAHGDADQIVPYKKGGFGGVTVGTFDMEGSYLVDSVARAKGVCSYLYTMEGKDHPSDTIGIDYLVSVVYRMMLHMHAVINSRSFCCGLELHVNPVDTLYYEAGGEPVCLAADVENDNGSAELKWCGISCLPSASSSPTITLQPDTSLHYVACMVYEGQCQAVTLNMVKEGAPVACETSVRGITANEVLLQVYPQPVSGGFTIHAKYPNRLNQFVTIEIFDVAGRRVYSRDAFTVDELNEKVDANGWAAGRYLLKLSATGTSIHKKLIITY